MKNIAAQEDIPQKLVYVTDQKQGFTRKVTKKNFNYHDLKGKKITNESEITRINKLAIPPAYKSVWICSNPAGHIQATGVDA